MNKEMETNKKKNPRLLNTDSKLVIARGKWEVESRVMKQIKGIKMYKLSLYNEYGDEKYKIGNIGSKTVITLFGDI